MTRVSEIEEEAPAVAVKERVADRVPERRNGETRTRANGGDSDQNAWKKKESGATGEARKVDPSCANASNPYHRCTKNCSSKNTTTWRPMHGTKPGPTVQNGYGSKDDIGMTGRRNVDPKCANSTNPYHQCTEYCSGKKPELKDRIRRASSDQNWERSKEDGKAAKERFINPACHNASNPYHQCTDSCSKRSIETRKHAKGSKSAENIVLKMRDNKMVDPSCVNSSNPYHKCTASCTQRNHKFI